MADIPRNMFVNRDSGALAKVTEVNSSFAVIETIWPGSTKYSMPIGDYDGGVFGEQWRPATTEEMRPADGAGFRLPSVIPADWNMGKEAVDLGLTVVPSPE